MNFRLQFWLMLLLSGGVFAAGPGEAVRPPIRVVSQFVGGDELLLALAAPDQIAALSHLARTPEFSAVAEAARAFPQIEKGDAESVLKFDPTLVLCADYSRGELVEAIKRSGVRVIVFDRYHTLEDAYANLRLLGGELGPAALGRAERIIADCQARARTLREKLRGAKGVRVIAPSTYGVVGGAETTFQDLCDHAGAVNLAATLGGLRGHQPPPSERMLTWPIDRVVLAGDDVASALKPFLTLSPYQFMPAVKERRVALIAPYMLSSVTHHRIEAYECLARALHPELFP